MWNRKKSYLLLLTVLTILAIISYQRSVNDSHPQDKKYVLPPPKNFTGNWPDSYLSNSKRPTEFNNSCARFPQMFDIRIKNNLWQMQEASNGTFHLFSAYVDRRNTSLVVRILGTYNRLEPQESFFCQLWYQNNSQPVVVPTEKILWLFRPLWGADRDGFDHPYLISCSLSDKEVPMSVSVVEKACDNASNNLKIVYKTAEKKKNFVVCVKGLSFPFEDNSLRLVEWIELLGAQKINFYEFNIHPETKRLLDYYSASGRVEVTPLTLVGDVSNLPFLQSRYLKAKTTERRLQEVIPYNDCLYKHLQEFKYVVLLDTDEIIVPAENTWLELIETLVKLKPDKSSYVARNVYFLDSHLHEHEWFANIPKHMHMLQHVYRAKNHTKSRSFVKGFHDTDRVLAVHNHFPLACMADCSNEEMDVKLAQLQHYRKDCVQGIRDCEDMKKNSVLDTRVWNFKDELIDRVEKVLNNLANVDDNYF